MKSYPLFINNKINIFCDSRSFESEFHSVATPTLASMLSELRKFGVGLVLAHQFLSQIDPLIRDAILGNVGTIIAFRVGLPDAEFLAKEFFPDFTPLDFTRLPNHEIYLRLMIDGKVSHGFSGESTLGGLSTRCQD